MILSSIEMTISGTGNFDAVTVPSITDPEFVEGVSRAALQRAEQ